METGGGCLNIEEGTEVDGWIRGPVLGSGGFGTVILWSRKTSTDTIALKQCRWGHDSLMTPKHKYRWKLEVDIMKRLFHPNVVKAVEVPPSLDVPETELPLLAMEYCNGGDLRKVLSKPENCCGLNEKQVRTFVRHIASAIQYLHSNRIIHRDLKPENIVLQETDNKVTYKLIDLGYAKELDQGSLCTSFVGTLQYLAPELFMNNKYSCTVDYWSFGLVTHEVITGQRPFLPHMTPAQWFPFARDKSSNHICAYLDDDGKIVFSEEISPYSKITKILKKYLEDWLKVVLEWDSKNRGRKGDLTAFELLDQMLNKQIIQVYCTDTCSLLTSEINDNVSIEDLQVWLKQETGIPKTEQELLLPNGLPPDPNKNATQCWSDPEEGEAIIFLSKKHSLEEFKENEIHVPPLVARMIRSPNLTVEYETQKSAWAQAIYLCYQEKMICTKLLQAHKANLLHLVSKNSAMYKAAMKLTNETIRLSSKVDFFRISLQKDMESYEIQAKNGGISSKKLFQKWENSFEIFEKFQHLQDKIAHLEVNSANSNIRTLDLQRSSYARSKFTDLTEEVHKKILASYHRLKKRTKDQRTIPSDNNEIVQLICSFLQQKRQILHDIYQSLIKVKQVKCDIDDLQLNLEKTFFEIQNFTKEIETIQLQRQNDMWFLLDSVVKKLKSPTSPPKGVSSMQSSMRPFYTMSASSNSSDQYSLSLASSQDSIQQTSLNFNSPSAAGWDPNHHPILGEQIIPQLCSLLSQHSSLSSSKDSLSSSVSLSTVRVKSRQDSVKLLEENEQLRSEMDNMMTMINKKCKNLNSSEDSEETLHDKQ